jgi:hypothetical protein
MSDQIEIPVFYSNLAYLQSSPFDFIFTFGVNQPIVGEKGDVKTVATHFAKISMSPQHFKVFATMCIEQLKNYEKRFGQIKLPKPKVKAKTKVKNR